MGFWSWFWIWLALLLASSTTLMLIGLSLFHRAAEVVHQVTRISSTASPLLAAMASKAAIAERDSDLLTPTEEARRRRSSLLKNKTKKRAARQRSLITALKNIDVNESRFTNV